MKIPTEMLTRNLAICALFSEIVLFHATPAATDNGLDNWLTFQTQTSIAKMELNISPADAWPGAVVASPERFDPPYYYNWVRDAALTMDTVESLYEKSQGADHLKYRGQLADYVSFTHKTQTDPSSTGLGEPKFNIDGTAYQGGWCRPQNDGPALRALALIHFANTLLSEGQGSFVKTNLYDGLQPSQSVIKVDLEFLSHHWSDDGCDIWEEVHGQHFFTRLMQWRALSEGASLASQLGDPGAAQFYKNSAVQIANTFASFWSDQSQAFIPTLNQTAGLNYKTSGLDSQVILGLVHSQALPFTDARVLATMTSLINAFKTAYSINYAHSYPGVAIGRYPEDLYDGGTNTAGNPWFLITAAFANLSYKIASEYADQNQPTLAQNYFEQGDLFIERVRTHADPSGSLSEQINRDTGYMESARDLTWSHVEMIQAEWAREVAKSKLP
jgi:glucoamylase